MDESGDVNAAVVDPSVRIEHARLCQSVPGDLLRHDRIPTHPMIPGESASGTPTDGTPADRTLARTSLSLLAQAGKAGVSKAMGWIEYERLYGLGCGWIDFRLLASSLIRPGALLRTHGKRLAARMQIGPHAAGSTPAATGDGAATFRPESRPRRVAAVATRR